MRNTLNTITGQALDVLDFDDDRLSPLLKHLSKHKLWHALEHDLNQRIIEVYERPKEVVRYDPTTVSRYHQVTEDGLMPFGHSKDDANRPPIK